MTLDPEDAPGDDSVVPAPGTVFVEGSGDERRRWVVYRREGRMVSLRVEGTQKHRRVNCDVVYYYEEGAAARTDDDYQDTCEHSSTKEVAQWCAETRVLEQAGDGDDDLAALRALKDRAAAAGASATLPAGAAARAAAAAAAQLADVPAVGAHLALRDDASVKGVAGRVDVLDNGHAWIDLQTMDGDLHRVRSTQVVAATLSPAEVARCGKTLSPGGGSRNASTAN